MILKNVNLGNDFEEKSLLLNKLVQDVNADIFYSFKTQLLSKEEFVCAVYRLNDDIQKLYQFDTQGQV